MSATKTSTPKTSTKDVARFADMFMALGAEPRLRIMRLLLSAHPDGLVVGEIQAELETSASTLSHHLDKLKNEDLVHVSREGTFPPGSTRVLAVTPPYDHCNFTALDGAPTLLVDRFRELLLGMSYADPAVRLLLDLEGLKQWRAGRTEGYAVLNEAVDRFGSVEPFVRQLAGSCV